MEGEHAPGKSVQSKQVEKRGKVWILGIKEGNYEKSIKQGKIRIKSNSARKEG